MKPKVLNVYLVAELYFEARYNPRPPNVPLLRALWSLSDGIWGHLRGTWGVLAELSQLYSWLRSTLMK